MQQSYQFCHLKGSLPVRSDNNIYCFWCKAQVSLMSESVSLLARSAPEVKAKGWATPVGVPSGQRRSPYHSGVCHRELMCSTGVARRWVTRMSGVKLNNGNTGTNNMVSSTIHCCVFSHSGRLKSRQFGLCQYLVIASSLWYLTECGLGGWLL
jgi:hypothetical protein